MQDLPTAPKRVRSATTAPRTAARAITKREAHTAAPRRSFTQSIAALVLWLLVITLTAVNIAIDGPVSAWGFDEMRSAIPRYAGHPEWVMSNDIAVAAWLFIFAVSTLSLAHVALHWRQMIQPRRLIASLLFAAFILIPSQSFDLADSTVGLYSLFIPFDLAQLNMPALYIAMGVAVFGSFVAPTWALILTKEAYDDAQQEQADVHATLESL